MSGPDLLARIDRLMAELAELRAEVAADTFGQLSEGPPADANDLAEANLLDTTSAAARTGFPRNTITRWCREGIGVRRGGRWLVDIEKLRVRLNGGA